MRDPSGSLTTQKEEMNMMRYMVNGWSEKETYFLSIGHFTEEEMNALADGETVTKNGNMFYMEDDGFEQLCGI